MKKKDKIQVKPKSSLKKEKTRITNKNRVGVKNSLGEKSSKKSEPTKDLTKSLLVNKTINPKSKSLHELLHTRAILEVLQTEDKEFSVEEISRKSKLSSASVYIWICSIGKRMKEIKKVGIGLYKYEALD